MRSLPRSRPIAFLLASLLGVAACEKKGPSPEEAEAQRKSDIAEAQARLRNGKIGDAERYYAKVLEQHPEDPEAIAGMGEVRYNQKNYAEAEALLKQAVTLGQNFPKHHAILGELYSLQDRAEESAAAYGKAFEIDPEKSEYGLAYGRALNRAERYAEAEKILREVADLDPQAITFDKIGVNTVLGDSLRGQNKLDDALRTYMKAQTTYASDKMARAGAAFVYEAKDDIKHALDEWSAYIQRDCCSDYSRNVAQKKITELSPAEAEQAG